MLSLSKYYNKIEERDMVVIRRIERKESYPPKPDDGEDEVETVSTPEEDVSVVKGKEINKTTGEEIEKEPVVIRRMKK
jgi:hypothetical protein